LDRGHEGCPFVRNVLFGRRPLIDWTRLDLRMAKPPEPLSELIPNSKLICVAEVIAILALGPKPPEPGNARKLGKHAKDAGWQAASQKVRLKIERCLSGQGPADGMIDVEKPVAPYTLRVGDKGPFFIDARNHILGRYGPDTRPLDQIEQALSAKK